MKPDPKDHPGEWRKSALLTALGLAILSSILRWRHVVSTRIWVPALTVIGIVALFVLWRPRWFRGYHRFSMRVGFFISQALGRAVLALFFFLVLTPVGLILRWAGKEPLQLKRSQSQTSYWQAARDYGPLGRLF